MVRDRGEIWIVRFSGGGRVLTAHIICSGMGNDLCMCADLCRWCADCSAHENPQI